MKLRSKLMVFLMCLMMSINFLQAQIDWPQITNTNKPWTRWWWEGSAVTAKDLTINLEQYQQAGLGGVEITPIYGIKGHEKEFIPFLSKPWMEMLSHTLKESKRLNIGVDLANGTGWPFGGPWVSDSDASKTIYFKTFSVRDGLPFYAQMIYNQDGFVRTANNQTALLENVKRPLTENPDLQSLALDQIQFKEKLMPFTVMAYAENAIPIDLTNDVSKDGILNWTAPAGNWTIYSLYQSLHGKMVERAAPGGEGYAIDHFSALAIKNYFNKFNQAFKGYDLSYLRSFFNDSYEVDDARGQANWTPDFFQQFKEQKGYDLKGHLPALFSKTPSPYSSSILYDYRSVIDELLLKSFTMQWNNWAHAQGKIVRNQSHGSPANTLDLYSAVDIPETEGTDILRFKFASSAANVTGKKLVSAESATWLNDHFLSSLGDVKKALDLYFLGGVNHVFYHGTAYSPASAPWPGWLFYAAVHFQQVNPQWKDFHKLNSYVARIQSFLQQGRPDHDVLLYYPIADRYAEPGNALLQHFDGMEKNFEDTDFEALSKWMSEKGYGFDFFSDRQLTQFTVANNKIISGGNKYQTILLPANKYIPEASMNKILQLVGQGASVVFYKNLPEKVTGFFEFEKRQQAFEMIKKSIHLNSLTNGIKTLKTPTGGTLVVGENMDSIFGLLKVRNESMTDLGLRFIRRKMDNELIYFIENNKEEIFDGWVPVKANGAGLMMFDPMTEKKGKAIFKKNADGQTLVYLHLFPHETCILKTSSTDIKGAMFQYAKPVGPRNMISGNWSIEFLKGGPVLPPSFSGISNLESWTNLEDEAVKNFSGTAKYTTTFKKPIGNAKTFLLELGQVQETAEVFINNKKIGTCIGPGFRIEVPATVLLVDNKLEIVVANLMANRISYMDRNKIPWKIFYNTNMPAKKKENAKNGLFDSSDWKPLPSGLLGPVSITPLK